MSRKAIGAVVLLLWIAGFAWMLRRYSGGDVNRRLTEAALRVQPATYYYTVSYRGEKIGAASSAIDTLVAALVSEDYYTGRFPLDDTLVPVSARFRVRLSRAFRLTDIALQVDRGRLSSKMSAFVQGDTTLVITNRTGPDSATPHIVALHGRLLPPGVVGVALMLGEEAKVGREEHFVVFNPMDGKPEVFNVKIAGDSLFTLVDSAGRGKAENWIAVHSDTVRAWRLSGDTKGLTVWVDREGRIVDATAPNGLHLQRTAFELAFDRARRR